MPFFTRKNTFFEKSADQRIKMRRSDVRDPRGVLLGYFALSWTRENAVKTLRNRHFENFF